jgi:hypothetical protein
MKGYNVKTLTQFLIERQADIPYATVNLLGYFTTLGWPPSLLIKGKQSGLVDILGELEM